MQNKKYTKCALIGCNVSWKDEITEAVLLNILSGKSHYKEWLGHIDVFFNELPQKIIIGFIQENNLSYEIVNTVFKSLPSALQGANFKGIYHE